MNNLSSFIKTSKNKIKKKIMRMSCTKLIALITSLHMSGKSKQKKAEHSYKGTQIRY